MRYRVLFTLAFAAIALLVVSCNNASPLQGNGNIQTKAISVTDFDKIGAVGTFMTIRYAQTSTAPQMQVTTDGNIFDSYLFEVKHGTLVIKPKRQYKNRSIHPTTFEITISSKELKDIELAGSIKLETTSAIQTDELKISETGKCFVNFTDNLLANKVSISMSGASAIEGFKLNSRTFSCEMAGKGTADLAGVVKESRFDIAGSGEVNALDLRVDRLKCKIAGNGIMQITVEKSLNADLLGNAHISYRGNPSEVKHNSMGNVTLTHLEN